MQLHALKMMVGMTAKEYMIKCEMLAERTRFNNTTLEDVYIWGFPHSSLSNVYSQTTLPSRLNKWKTVIHNLDQLYLGFAKLKWSMHPASAPAPQDQTAPVFQVSCHALWTFSGSHLSQRILNNIHEWTLIYGIREQSISWDIGSVRGNTARQCVQE